MMYHRKSGFTLVELLVVLAVIAIVSSISFGAFRSVTDGNQRTTCQSNMAQIYKSVRLYSQDFDGGLPYLNPLNNSVATPAPTDYAAEAQPATPAGGIGLWALYTFRVGDGDLVCPNNDVSLPLTDEGAQPSVNITDRDQTRLSGYIRNPKVFHCPADRFEKVVQYRDKASDTSCTLTPDKVANAKFSFSYTDSYGDKRTKINPGYLSYQAEDDPVAVPSAPRTTYSSFRKPESGAGVRVRQIDPFLQAGGTGNPTTLVERPMEPATIITWCRFHRSLDIKTDSRGVTVSGKRNFDNVLFSDGTVQALPAEQQVSDKNGNTGKCYGWQRVPREKADNMQDVTNCIPSP